MSKVNFVNTELPDIVELKNISQSYDGGKNWIIKDLDFLIEDKPDQGQFVAILGTSGCGKSSILRYICGLQKPTGGEVLIKGKPRDHNNRIGMVFQRYSCLPWYTVLENVELGLRYQGLSFNERRKQARRIIELVGLAGHEDKFAEYPLLSGGQLQRVAIAMNLAIKPEILVMDEPFGALDIKTRLDMQDLVNSIWRELKTTIIFVTHDISEAVYLAEDIYVMASNPGRFVEHYKIGLPLHREREIKRDKKFNDLVFSIEDKMMELQNGKI
jgi:NitT/TauT family transport system ATP-binding protein